MRGVAKMDRQKTSPLKQMSSTCKTQGIYSTTGALCSGLRSICKLAHPPPSPLALPALDRLQPARHCGYRQGPRMDCDGMVRSLVPLAEWISGAEGQGVMMKKKRIARERDGLGEEDWTAAESFALLVAWRQPARLVRDGPCIKLWRPPIDEPQTRAGGPRPSCPRLHKENWRMQGIERICCL